MEHWYRDVSMHSPEKDICHRQVFHSDSSSGRSNIRIPLLPSYTPNFFPARMKNSYICTCIDGVARNPFRPRIENENSCKFSSCVISRGIRPGAVTPNVNDVSCCSLIIELVTLIMLLLWGVETPREKWRREVNIVSDCIVAVTRLPYRRSSCNCFAPENMEISSGIPAYAKYID